MTDNDIDPRPFMAINQKLRGICDREWREDVFREFHDAFPRLCGKCWVVKISKYAERPDFETPPVINPALGTEGFSIRIVVSHDDNERVIHQCKVSVADILGL